MADQPGGFVDDEQIIVFKYDFKKFFHNLSLNQAGVSFAPVKEKWNRLLPVLFVAAFALSRIPGLLPQNFSAAYAFAFCAGVYFSKKISWWLPILVLLVTDIGLNFYYQHKYPDDNVWSASNLANLAFNYAAYAVLIFLGRGSNRNLPSPRCFAAEFSARFCFISSPTRHRGSSTRFTIPNMQKLFPAGCSR